MAMEIESARSRLPPVTVQKMPLVQIPPTCMTLLEALVWLNLGVAEVPLVVWAKVTVQGDSAVSEELRSGVVSQIKSTRPVLPAATQGK